MDKIKMMLSLALTTGGGVGYIPCMAGTVGSLVGLLLWVICPYKKLCFGLSVILGYWASYTVLLNRPGDPDPSYIVIDEIAGIYLTYLLMEGASLSLGPFALGLGFIAFRFFDIIKPWPIGLIDHYFSTQETPWAAFGIMVDDLVAAFFAAAVSYGSLWIWARY